VYAQCAEGVCLFPNGHSWVAPAKASAYEWLLLIVTPVCAPPLHAKSVSS